MVHLCDVDSNSLTLHYTVSIGSLLAVGSVVSANVPVDLFLTYLPYSYHLFILHFNFPTTFLNGYLSCWTTDKVTVGRQTGMTSIAIL